MEGGDACERWLVDGVLERSLVLRQPVLSTALLAMQVMIDRGRIDEPSSCHACGNTMSMELVHNRCLFTDKQMIRLQVQSASSSHLSIFGIMRV